MKKNYSLFFSLLILISSNTFAQPVLKPSIGLGSLPADNTAICSIPCSTTYNFNTDGLQLGDTIPQFQFYTIAGVPYDAQTLLNTGKPLCIVAGSYTCPVWRGKIVNLNTLLTTYGSQVNFLVVYVVEAHPMSPDQSPYSCSVWNPTQNSTDGVMYLQPTTYGARKATANDMMNNLCTCMPNINVPVVIDGPCNEFWLRFGPAPNNAYLIDPRDGTVNCKHGWYDQSPNDMNACIASLLNTLGTNETNSAYGVEVFPNPFSLSTTIRFNDPNLNTTSISINLLDVTGRTVKTEIRKNATGFEIDKGKLESGIYFYELMENNIPVTKGKLIIN